MDMSLKDVLESIQMAARSVGAEVASPWFYLQFGIILAAAGLAYAADTAIHARVDMASLAMRWPLPLRHFARVMVKSASTAVFAVLMIISRIVMWHATWPSRSYLIAVSAKLALAWLVIRLVTSVIDNAFIVKLVSIAAWVVAALSIIGQLDWAAETLDSFAVVVGGLRLTPLLLIKAGALLIVALWLSNIASNFIDGQITRSTDLTPSIQVLLVKIIRIGLMVVAVAIALSAVGINLSALAVLSGAVGVGIGFGLQKIVANFISGIILLVDKSVKPGDLVTIGDSQGRISAMKTRYISVAAGDGREFLIPNEDLVTQKVTNWTYTDKNTLVKIAFAVNYDADPRLVCKLAIDTAAAHARALKGKPPNCILTEFAELGMKFSLTFWIADPDGMDNVKSDVMLALWDAFKQQGIRVPYPVRELRIRGGALPVESVVEVSN
ncbi:MULTISPECIES: mechanosensitive ion channel family protein [Bradyrhizobium]|jgi:small-conductance mechanosensitive channel|uniref:mechanosensitive ion channel family protein n=1 Tax=Bradyrhizobium TaxID=374 RepID=UPI000480E340|nr:MULTISPECIES: mechanosensitive ion channel domain-containing protein [Bradyrhizobium]MBR1158060.1 mechanosensitive ion channel [Bradyrhizobium elkanii]MCS3453381.1 small-conductance mechanosensitive channel [Bradyrhizobium elkanii]MCS3564511.1 small-conductance mechanosensitive channel [Bradyrhizobium elkanii]MCW2145657.1 small-conductance mechanosensitive channel [Bradyrhizobium elkanii]MCW2355524.1 small-conductance mechanosensitive channel [Bradyrhizobium elkanii]